METVVMETKQMCKIQYFITVCKTEVQYNYPDFFSQCIKAQTV